MKNLNFFIFCLASLFYIGNAQAQITVSPWKIHEGTQGVINFTTNHHGDPAAYKMASIPQGDNGWDLAQTDANGEVFFKRVSNLNCNQQIDFTYFKTKVFIPTNTKINKFSVSYTKADDGARIYIFNTDHPNGAYSSNADLMLGRRDHVGNVDLKQYVKKGEVNTVVIVQFDDCAKGNNVKGIHINVNGEEIKTSAPNTIEHCGNTYETVELNGRTWLKTNIKVPAGGFAAMKQCCSALQHVSDVKKNGNGRSPFTYSNFDYAAYNANNKVATPEMSHKRPYFSAFNNKPNDKHGAIFNHFALEQCDICPSGFRVPTEKEFKAMAQAENLMKRPNRAAEDWGAIGRIDGYGSVVRGRFGEYWTSTVDPANPGKAKAFVLKPSKFEISSEDKRTGCYVRCIKMGTEGEGAVVEIEANEFKVNAFSINQGRDRGLWYFGYNNNDTRTGRIVKKGNTGSTILKIHKVTVGGAGPDVYAFQIQGTDKYLSVEKGGGQRVFIESYPAGPPVEAQFRNHNAFTKATGAEQFSSFESIAKPKHYLRHTGFVLFVHKDSSSELYKQDASWKIEAIK